MQEQEIELAVGESVRVGEYIVTVVDVDADEVSVRIDPAEVRLDDDGR